MGEYLVHIRQIDDGIECRVGVRDGKRDDVDLNQQLHDYFRLDDDIKAIYAHLEQDPVVLSDLRAHLRSVASSAEGRGAAHALSAL